MRSLSPIAILWHEWHLSISHIFDACECNLDPVPPPPPPSRSFLVFLVFRPFLERLSCFGQDGHIRWRWQWFTERSMRHYTYCVAIYYEKDVRAGMPSFGKKCSEPRLQGRWSRWKLLKKLSGVFTGHVLHMGMKNLFLSMIRGQKKTKR